MLPILVPRPSNQAFPRLFRALFVSLLAQLRHAAIPAAILCVLVAAKTIHLGGANPLSHPLWTASDATGGGWTALRGADSISLCAMIAAGFIGMSLGRRRRE